MFPVVLGMLGEGTLSLATLRLLSSHLTAENHEELLVMAAGKSKREVEELLARYFPRPEVPRIVTRSGSRRAPRRATSYAWPRTCSDTRSPAEIWPKSSIGR
jgi:hypothetical protein